MPIHAAPKKYNRQLARPEDLPAIAFALLRPAGWRQAKHLPLDQAGSRMFLAKQQNGHFWRAAGLLYRGNRRVSILGDRRIMAIFRGG